MTVERSPQARRRQQRRSRQNRNAIAQAGPVTTIKPDGTRTTEQPITENVDRPGRPDRPHRTGKT